MKNICPMILTIRMIIIGLVVFNAVAIIGISAQIGAIVRQATRHQNQITNGQAKNTVAGSLMGNFALEDTVAGNIMGKSSLENHMNNVAGSIMGRAPMKPAVARIFMGQADKEYIVDVTWSQ